jgi:hypothetical protein
MMTKGPCHVFHCNPSRLHRMTRRDSPFDPVHASSARKEKHINNLAACAQRQVIAECKFYLASMSASSFCLICPIKNFDVAHPVGAFPLVRTPIRHCNVCRACHLALYPLTCVYSAPHKTATASTVPPALDPFALDRQWFVQ